MDPKVRSTGNRLREGETHMTISEKRPVGTVALALGAALFGFILGARVKVGNHGATLIVIPVGRDLVIGAPPSEARPSEARPSDAPAPELDSEEEPLPDELQADEV
jgi:hypothetical protein